MLLLKWRKIVWSKSSRYFLGTIQQINFHIMTQRCFMLCTTYTNGWSIICPLEVRCLTPLSVTAFVAEIGGPIEIHRPVASHLQTLSHNVLSSTPRHEWVQTHNLSGDRHCKFNYHTTMTVQVQLRWKVIVLLILMEFIIITVYKLSFHINQWKELVCWK